MDSVQSRSDCKLKCTFWRDKKLEDKPKLVRCQRDASDEKLPKEEQVRVRSWRVALDSRRLMPQQACLSAAFGSITCSNH